MAGKKLPTVLGRLGRLVQAPAGPRTTDEELMARFLGQRDEAAFAALMERHGALVLGVCERVLRNRHDAEDACQAVFLVLARKAASVRKCGSLASWLHGVALRVARKLQASLARRTAREAAAAAQKCTVSEPGDISWREVQRLVDEELDHLPSRYRAPLVLCYLQGRTQDEAARELGWTLGALRGQLLRGREKLRARFLRRGVTGASALAFTVLIPNFGSAAMPPTLVAGTVQASVPLAAGEAIPTIVQAHVAALTREVLHRSLLSKLVLAALVGVSGLVLVLAAGRWSTADLAPLPTKAAPVWAQGSRLAVPSAHVWCVAFSPDGKRLAAGLRGPLFDSGEFRVWDADTREVMYTLLTPRSVRCIAFAPDNQTLATAEHDGMARLRDAATGQVRFTLRGHRAQIDTVAFAADGKTLATSGWDQTVRLWDTATGQEIRTLEGHREQVFSVAFGGAAGILASEGADGTARLWQPETGKLLCTLRGHTSVVHWLAFSPDGKILATASWDKTVKLWDVPTGRPRATLQGHTETVLAVAFASDGKTLASSAGRRLDEKAPGEVILWDLTAHKARARLHLDDRVYGVAFSPDGSTLATAGWDGAVSLWHEDALAPPPGNAENPGELRFVLAPAQALDVEAPEPRKDYPEDYHPALKGAAKEIAGLLSYGPDVSECVLFEPDGLRITLPAGYPRQRSGTGVVTDFGVKGDFEITLSFELLHDFRAGGGNPTDLQLVIVPIERAEPAVWHKASQDRATLARALASPNQAGHFLAELSKWNPVLPRDQWGNEIFNNIEPRTSKPSPPATAKAGRLRLVRHGSALSYYMSEDPEQEFTLLHKDQFGTKDLKNVRVLGSTGGPAASLDVLVTDLRIRADGFVKASAPLLEPTAAAPAWNWRLILLAMGVPFLVIAFALAAWLQARRRRAEPTVGADAAPAIVFACPGCGKRLKAMSERAGSRLKCPHCGQTVEVPSSKPESPEELP